MPSPGVFPTRDNCDPNNPEEHFLWAFVALPGVLGGPLIMPIDYYRKVSRRLWDLGFRHTYAPSLEWVAPTASDPNWVTSPGSWVPAGSIPPKTEQQRASESLAQMTAQQRDELYQVLMRGEPFPESPAGVVAKALSVHQRDVVLQALEDGVLE